MEDKPTCLCSFKFLDYISDLNWYFFTVDILILKNYSLERQRLYYMILSNQKQPPDVFYEKGCSQKFHKICWKTPVSELVIKREIPTQVFSCEFCEIFKNNFFTEPLRWLLLRVLMHDPLSSQSGMSSDNKWGLWHFILLLVKNIAKLQYQQNTHLS